MSHLIGIDLPETELLAGLAEEATELAQAALKLRRVLDGTNPTPVSEEDARRALQEEVDDVQIYELALNLTWSIKGLRSKTARWQERLTGKKVIQFD